VDSTLHLSISISGEGEVCPDYNIFRISSESLSRDAEREEADSEEEESRFEDIHIPITNYTYYAF
jgi:hypothetical protein